MPNNLDRFERTYCDCAMCRAACRTMPGSLAPGDLDRIAAHVGVDMEDGDQAKAFMDQNFLASEGALVAKGGQMFRIPTVVPAQKPDGRCVFLTEDERCSIHPAAPFGCSRFNVCGGRTDTPRGESARSAAQLQAIMDSPDYLATWLYLTKAGKVAAPVAKRRAAMENAIERQSEHGG